MTDAELQKLADDTIKWANDLLERFTSTTAAGILNSQKNHLEQLIEDGDMNLANIAALELAQTCNYLEEQDNEY